ncbi:MAG TPA: metalloregulator ArsR/SmtB family transcription factor [Thermoanaerobaculia bacterium]|nr:metalloregulator ArsR/SmtB family transcription factor [Thermoanaerobaculia bacterium]
MTTVDLESMFQALSDRTRLRLLNLISGGDLCVCYFVEILGEPQPKVSRHLAYLRRIGLVSARREGKWMHYRINRPSDPRLATVLDAALAAAESDRQLQRDRSSLERACCAVRLPEPLQKAPRPLTRPSATSS